MPESTLGPQCFTCRKRQVKCDSSKPKCDRCKKDGLTCRGYKRPFTIIEYTPPQESQLNHRLRQELKVARAARQGTAPERPFTIEAEYLDLLESFQYYDKYVMPRITPAHWPFRRTEVDRDVPWHVLPIAVQHCVIVSLRSMLASVQDQNPMLLRNDLQHYRGSSLSQMQFMLRDADADPYGIALACMILLMGADISLSRFGSWIVHFNAARKLIALRGGMNCALNDLPQSRNLLLRFVISDIFTGSTCNSMALGRPSWSQFEYADFVNMDADLIRQCCLCPSAILYKIAQVTDLRTNLSQLSSLYEQVLNSIDGFDPTSWAISLTQRPELGTARLPFNGAVPLESITQLADAAQCFQLATHLYLLCSCRKSSSSSATASVNVWRQELADRLQSFFSGAEIDHEGALRTQLWKFLTWPLFISFYVRIGWNLFSDADERTVQNDIDNIKAFANSFESSALRATATHLQHVLDVRLQKNAWTWDDGFPSRYSFVL